MTKKKLICVVGESKSGKDHTITIAEHFSEHFEDTVLLKEICSYTTRPMREGEKNGVTHYFISEEEKEKMMSENEVLAYTKIEDPSSGKKGYEYFTLLNQLDSGNIYIIDPQGLDDLKKRFGDILDILVIYIHSPFIIRKLRARKSSDYKKEYKNRVRNERKQFLTFKRKKEYDHKLENIQWFSFITAYRFYFICKKFLEKN